MHFRKEKKKKKAFSYFYLNEFNVKDGFGNRTVTKIFDALSNEKKVWKKNKYTT